MRSHPALHWMSCTAASTPCAELESLSTTKLKLLRRVALHMRRDAKRSSTRTVTAQPGSELLVVFTSPVLTLFCLQHSAPSAPRAWRTAVWLGIYRRKRGLCRVCNLFAPPL